MRIAHTPATIGAPPRSAAKKALPAETPMQ